MLYQKWNSIYNLQQQFIRGMMPFYILSSPYVQGFTPIIPKNSQFYYLPLNFNYYFETSQLLQNDDHIPITNTLNQAQNLISNSPSSPSNNQSHNFDQIQKNEEGQLKNLRRIGKASTNNSKWKQKFGRNIKSNIFVSMIKFVQRERFLKPYVLKIIQKHNLVLKANEFYNLLKKKQRKLRTYVTEAEIQLILRMELPINIDDIQTRKQEQFKKVLRILGRLYLHNYHIPYAYNSAKIKPNSRKLHVTYVRAILL